MRILKMETRECTYCKRRHPVATMSRKETRIYKGVKISFEAVCEFCGVADKMYETEDMMAQNHKAMEKAYRQVVGQEERVEAQGDHG